MYVCTCVCICICVHTRAHRKFILPVPATEKQLESVGHQQKGWTLEGLLELDTIAWGGGGQREDGNEAGIGWGWVD